MKIGFVGWRGMVGSVLMERMQEEGDFNVPFDRVFFSTSNVGGQGPSMAEGQPLRDANNVSLLKECDVIITCQGGEWTSCMYPRLREKGWKGIWIDSASVLRMNKDSVIVLDPVNRGVIDSAMEKGVKVFVGGNCTVSLMLMACHGLFKSGLVEWINSMTYQAASGAGSKHMKELVEQMMYIGEGIDLAQTALKIDKMIFHCLNASFFPCSNFGVPLAFNLIPWIDSAVGCGQTREEWKGSVEANKILGSIIPIDGICVRVGVMRCHSQALLIKLRRSIPLDEIEGMIEGANEWVKVVPNEKEATIHHLSPVAVSGTLDVAVGRIHKALMGEEYLQLFTVGDQLLWGAAEPIRRTLRILIDS